MAHVVPFSIPDCPPTIVYVSGDLLDPVVRSMFTREVHREMRLAREEGRSAALHASLDVLMRALETDAYAGRMLVARAGHPLVDAGPVPAPTRARLIVHLQPPPWVEALLAGATAA